MTQTLAYRLLDAAIALLLGSIWRVIKAAVAAQESSTLSGPQKQALVFAQAKAEAMDLGARLSDSLVNLGIEAALQIVRRNRE